MRARMSGLPMLGAAARISHYISFTACMKVLSYFVKH
jgi:hypothetical protein